MRSRHLRSPYDQRREARQCWRRGSPEELQCGERNKKLRKSRRKGRYAEMERRTLIGGLGAASVWPLIARAHRSRPLPTLGILWHAGSEQEEALFLGEVRHGLQDLGYVEGENIRLINTYAAERYDRFAANAAALVGQNVDLIVAVTRQAALAAQRATKSIPIVSVVVPDPVGSGLVASLARPGGNITGLSNMGVQPCRKTS